MTSQRWSVSVQAEGDRMVGLEEVVALADAVASKEGIASGFGTMSFGAQMVVSADSADTAVDMAISALVEAAETAGLPPWPVTRAEVIGEDELGLDE